jgi:hypothetical protein
MLYRQRTRRQTGLGCGALVSPRQDCTDDGTRQCTIGTLRTAGRAGLVQPARPNARRRGLTLFARQGPDSAGLITSGLVLSV